MNTMIAIIDEQAEVLTIPTAREAAEQAEKYRKNATEVLIQSKLPKAIQYFADVIRMAVKDGLNHAKIFNDYRTMCDYGWKSRVGMTFEEFDSISDEFIKFFQNLGYNVYYKYTRNTKPEYDLILVEILW